MGLTPKGGALNRRQSSGQVYCLFQSTSLQSFFIFASTGFWPGF
jgi:hypothetical protein